MVDINELNIGGAYIKKDELKEINTGVILGDLRIQKSKEYSDQYLFNVRLNEDMEGEIPFNKTSIGILAESDEFGKQTENWVGNKILVIKRMVKISSNKQQEIVLVFPDGTDADEIDKNFRKVAHMLEGMNKKGKEEQIETIEG